MPLMEVKFQINGISTAIPIFIDIKILTFNDSINSKLDKKFKIDQKIIYLLKNFYIAIYFY